MNLLKFDSEIKYKKHFIKKYCEREIYTFSKMRVKFYEDQFEHSFYESA